jgi:hypothetical protein
MGEWIICERGLLNAVANYFLSVTVYFEFLSLQ